MIKLFEIKSKLKNKKVVKQDTKLIEKYKEILSQSKEKIIEQYDTNEQTGLTVKEAEKNGIKGKETTPFLLGKIKEITKGASLEANIQLVYNNAKLASKIASSM